MRPYGVRIGFVRDRGSTQRPHFAVAFAIAIVSTPAVAEPSKTQSAALQATDPAIARRILAARNLVNLPDGSFISTVEGRQSDIFVRPGDRVGIIGKGFLSASAGKPCRTFHARCNDGCRAADPCVS